MALRESGEDYLETIYSLEQETGTVRSTDVAKILGVSRPSVARAIQVLKENGYIEHESYGAIQLTEKGREKARLVYRRHVIITRFLVTILQVEPKTAEQDACRAEHVFSDETMEKLTAYLEQEMEKL